MPAWRKALDEANRIRLHRAAVKRRIAAGELTVAEALDDPEIRRTNHRHDTGVTLKQLLTWQHRWGPYRAERFLRHRRFDPDEYVGELSGTIRRRLATALRQITRK